MTRFLTLIDPPTFRDFPRFYLHTRIITRKYLKAEGKGFEPSLPFRVGLFSKQVQPSRIWLPSETCIGNGTFLYI